MSRGDVRLRIVRSDGREYTLGDNEWRIPNDGLENWATISHGVTSVEMATRDGALVTNKRVNSIDRTVVARLADWRMNEAKRAEVIEFFNPKHSFEAHLLYEGRERWCSGEQIGFACSEGNIYQPASLTWTLLCSDPYLKSEDGFGKDIAAISPMFGFPWMSFLPESKGTNDWAVVGIREYSNEVLIENDSDVESYMRIVLRFSGDVTYPYVRIGDSMVKLNTSLLSPSAGEWHFKNGDVVEIDAREAPPTVRLNGENAINLLTKDSDIMGMVIQPGSIVLSYGADRGESELSVSVYFHRNYLGV